MTLINMEAETGIGELFNFEKALRSGAVDYECRECGHKFLRGSRYEAMPKCPLCGGPTKKATNR